MDNNSFLSLDILFVIGLAYLLGSIPFGLLWGQLFGIGDIRKMGSGNIGATNALRLGGRALGVVTLLSDAGKGALAVMLAASYQESGNLPALAALAAFCGHIWPIWLRFRGGKGVAVGLGSILVLSWPWGVTLCCIWLVATVWSRYAAIGALTTYSLAPVYAWFWEPLNSVLLALMMALLVWFRHQDNIMRLRKGTENAMGKE